MEQASKLLLRGARRTARSRNVCVGNAEASEEEWASNWASFLWLWVADFFGCFSLLLLWRRLRGGFGQKY